MVAELEAMFPRLRTAHYRITSPPCRDYNCIAWAAGEVSAWWWPRADPGSDVGHWPAGVPEEETLAAFESAYATLGYVRCASEGHEPGYEKVALFASPERVPTHAARQLPEGRWTSKLGRREDIEHDLRDIEGEVYGAVVLVLGRLAPPLASPP
jgi:hypothetical protein